MATITTRSGKGTPLTNNEVDSNFTNLNTDKVEKSGDSMTGNLSFGDNDKAIFGAGSDLQIYHDATGVDGVNGAGSYIEETGTGNLWIMGSQFVSIEKADGTNRVLQADTTNGDIELKYQDATKLATTSTGINVTGTVTADGLTVDNSGDAITLTNGDGLTQLGKMSSDATDGFVIEGKANNNLTLRTKANTAGEGIKFQDSAGDNMMFIDGTTGDISFYEDTGTTPKFFWDASAESLGIGVQPETWYPTNPAIQIGSQGSLSATNTGYVSLSNNVYRDTDGAFKHINTGAVANINIDPDSTIRFRQAASATADSAITWSEAMRIDSSGRVGIGTSSPTYKLDVAGIVSSEVASGDARYRFKTGTKGGWLGIPSWNDDALYLYAPTTTASEQHVMDFNGTATDGFVFRTGATPTERMRIDSGGNLLVGTTSESSWANTAGHVIRPNSSYTATRDGAQPLLVNRLNSDGIIIDIRKDGATVGSIGTANGGDLYIGNDDTGLLFAGGSDAILPRGTAGAARDAAIDLGLASHRFKDLYLSGGVYLGGTGSANYLDDYETGSFTPTALAGVTGFTVSAAKYVKIGRTVTVTMYLASFSGASSAALSIGGLPFTVLGSTYHTGSFETGSAGKMGMFRAQSGGSNFIAYYPDTSTAVRTSFAGNDIGSQLIGSFTYMTS